MGARAALPPLGLRVGRARPRAAPGRAAAARGARPRAAAGSLRQLARARRAADVAAMLRPRSRATRGCASSSTRTPAWTPEIIEALVGTGAVDVGRLQGPLRPRGRGRAGAPARCTSACSRRFPTRSSRTRTTCPRSRALLAPHAGRVSYDAPIRTVGRPRRRAGPRAHDQRQADPDRRAARRCSRSTPHCEAHGIAHVRRRHGRARRRRAGRSSCSPRCSTRTARTTSRRAATTRSTPAAGPAAEPARPAARADRVPARVGPHLTRRTAEPTGANTRRHAPGGRT